MEPTVAREGKIVGSQLELQVLAQVLRGLTGKQNITWYMSSAHDYHWQPGTSTILSVVKSVQSGQGQGQGQGHLPASQSVSSSVCWAAH